MIDFKRLLAQQWFRLCTIMISLFLGFVKAGIDYKKLVAGLILDGEI